MDIALKGRNDSRTHTALVPIRAVESGRFEIEISPFPFRRVRIFFNIPQVILYIFVAAYFSNIHNPPDNEKKHVYNDKLRHRHQ